MTQPILTQDDLERVIMETAKHAGPEGMTQVEFSRACEQLEEMAVHAALFTAWATHKLGVGYDRETDQLLWWAVE